jgi:hypothetical protein
MALNAGDVRVAITGEMSVAPVGTVAPTSATSVLDADWVGLGYLSEDGTTEAPDESQELIKGWQNSATVRTVTTESNTTLTFTLIQSTKATLELYHKGSTIEAVTLGDGFRLNVLSPSPDVRAFVLDIIDGDVHERIYIPRGEVTERGEVTYASGEAVGYECTVTAYASDLGGGAIGPMVKFSTNPAWGDAES